ncbi:unnamed protein product [Schistosoma turkestanicum]|nr:unnamed protein product [Schistosoma turkestanicum]
MTSFSLLLFIVVVVGVLCNDVSGIPNTIRESLQNRVNANSGDESYGETLDANEIEEFMQWFAEQRRNFLRRNQTNSQ